jgi:hypothetical protein
MNGVGIEINRYPYEEPYAINLVFSANNGVFRGQLNLLCSPDELIKMGQGFATFPKNIPDEFLYEYGSKNPKDNFAYYFALRAYTIGQIGQCALEVIIEDRLEEPDAGCHFSIETEPWGFHRLGKSILKFAELKHTTLTWSLNSDDDELLNA